jgi:hypothetical protein
MNISISRYCYFSDHQTKQSIKEAVLAQLTLNCEPREHHGNEGNQNQEKDSCSDVLNIPVSNNHDKVDLANVNFQ